MAMLVETKVEMWVELGMEDLNLLGKKVAALILVLELISEETSRLRLM